MFEGDGPHTILLVDDDEEVREVLRRGLEREGFRVVAAADERDGVERAAYAPPDLILMELGDVPHGDALAVGRRVREGAGLRKEVALVAYSGAVGEVVQEGEAVEVGPREYVVLPENSGQLAGWLRRFAAFVLAALLNLPNFLNA